MLLTVLAAAGLAAAAQLAPPQCTPPSQAAFAKHGKLAWFDGSYEEALTQAATSGQLLFLSFSKRW